MRSLGLCVLLCACQGSHVERVESGIVAHYLPSCAPARVDRMIVEALGDFGIRDDALVSFDARAGKATLSSLPFESQLFRLHVETPDFSGVAIAPAGEGGATFDALVLPLGAHCLAVGSGLPALSSAAAVVLEGGDVLIAGGTRAGSALAEADAYRLDFARRLVQRDAMGMLVPRAACAAVQVGSESWIVGGAQSLMDGAPGLGSFERYSSVERTFVGLGRLAVPRARAGAARLLDGSVLVAGGQGSVGGAALDSLERISADGKTSTPLAARLPWPALEPLVLPSEAGLVWIAANVRGRLALALFDPASELVSDMEAPLGGLEFAPPVSLPGARLAIVEQRAGQTTGVIHIVLPDLSTVTLDRWLTPFSGLASPRVLALDDGKILLVALRGQEPTARVIDVGRREVRVRELDRPVNQLLLRDDGAVAELGDTAALLVREDERTRFDNPGGTLLASDADAVVLDAHTRWLREPLALVSQVSGARFDLALYRYQAVTVELTVQGPGELILRRSDGVERVIDLSATRVGPALCTLARASEGKVIIERSGEQVQMRAEGKEQTCRLEGFTGPLGLAFRALDQGVRVSDLVVTRR